MKILLANILILITITLSFSQTIPENDPTKYKPAAKGGTSVPKNKYVEKILLKLKKTRLSPKETQAYLKKEYKNQQLSPIEYIYYLNAKRKKLKQQKIFIKFSLDTALISSAFSEEYLSPYEKQILKKAQDSTTTLTKVEQKVYKRAVKKQKKIEKFKQKYTLTPQEKQLLKKAEIDTLKLSLSEKIKLLKVKQKQHRIQKIKEQKLASQPGWTPIKPKFSQQLMVYLRLSSTRKPSKYQQQLEQIKKRYQLSDKEKEVYNKYISNIALTPQEYRILNRALRKKQLYEKALYKLNQKYFWSLQAKSTIQSHKKHLKNTKKYMNQIKKSHKKQSIKTKLKKSF